MPVTVLADGLEYRVTGGIIRFDGVDGTIYYCQPSVTKAVIPNKIDGCPITNIGDYAFKDCSRLTSVTIPDSVTSIGYQAFSGCSSLTSLTIPNSVTSIGSNAFEDCQSLTDVCYSGTKDQWKTIEFGRGNSLLNNSIIHCTNGDIDDGIAISVEESGIFEGNITWSYGNGTLTIQGTGDMGEANVVANPPWLVYNDQIHTVHISDGVTSIGIQAFNDCTNLTSMTIPNSVTSIGVSVFKGCSSLTSINIPGSVTSIENYTFNDCSSLTNVTIPDSVTDVGQYVFEGCNRLTDGYYGGSEGQWKQISIGLYNDPLTNATIHYNSTGSEQGGSATTSGGWDDSTTPSDGGNEYIYDTTDTGEDTKLDADRLNRVTDPASAARAVRDMVNGMTQVQKDSPTGIDLATLYAETAIAKAASKSFDDDDILINAAAVADLEAEATQALTAVETALVNGGIATARYLSSAVTLTTDSTSEISIRIDPDILTTGVDKIRVEGPSYALTFAVSELEEDLTGILMFKAEPVNTADAALTSGNDAASLTATLLVNRATSTGPVYLANTGANAVKVTLPGGSTSNPVTVSLPKDSSKDTTYQAVINWTGAATASKYNPATTNIDGKVNASGTYTVTAKEVNFTDITNKSAEMQKAIKYLASKGIISGTGGTNYSPDASISRAEIAALIVRALGKLNSSATNSFTDVKSSDWYYAAAGSSQKHGYISGFEDNTFKGTNPINKEQIVAVAARVLINDMKYKTPSNTGTYLSKYSDTVASWAQSQVALATKENLVVYRTDGTFSGAKNMTRGDAAIIIYRLFQKIW